MKKILIAITLCLFTLTGCNKPTQPQIEAGLTLAGQTAAYQLLTRAAKKSPDTTKEAALELDANLSTSLIPYINGNPLILSDELLPVLESKLGAKLSPTVQDSLAGAIIILTSQINLPPATKLGANELADVKAFATGVQVGTEQFLVGAK